MNYYLISAGGEPVALVADLEMARAIARCQPWGDYLVESLEVGEPIAAQRPSPQRSVLLSRSGKTLPSWRRVARDSDTSDRRPRRPAR